MTLEAANQIRREKGINLRLGLFDDKMPESWKCHTGRAALVDDCSDAGAHSDHVGIQAEPTSDVLIEHAPTPIAGWARGQRRTNEMKSCGRPYAIEACEQIEGAEAAIRKCHRHPILVFVGFVDRKSSGDGHTRTAR